MASIWKLDGQDIYVDTFQRNPKGEVVELNPINSTASIYHKIFTADEEIQFAGTVIGSGYEANIRALWGDEITLITDLALGGYSIQVLSIQSIRQPTVTQKVDTAQDSEAPVYKVTITAKVV
jgi:hypothetical protein